MRKKILIIEDSADRQEEWKELLNKYPINIIQAFSLEEAERAFNDNPDLSAVAVDACVPGNEPNTMELARKMRNSFTDRPMIAISNVEDFNDILMSAGCDYKTDKFKFVQKIKEILNF
ncbi:MAG: hypothetical protein UT90_C0005G0053 [Parcubacteria group bacterium GW2011_GWA1_40_21]|nr:MAG: hypothetical protein UT90_C0005G0053 [Parcubacteria group bacterium GW2011_GWA1_40_21]